MTSSRLVRGTKARIFIYIGAVFIITAIVACYNNTLSQLDEVRKSSEICHQQEENLSTQLQVISDYKQRLEKTLNNEKAEHQQFKAQLESKFREEKSKNEKSANEAALQFSSLQQHFKLLETQHEDFKEDCSKTQNKQLNEINDLQAKLKEVQEEAKKLESVKESLRSQLDQIKSLQEKQEKENILLKLQLKEKCASSHLKNSRIDVNYLKDMSSSKKSKIENDEQNNAAPPPPLQEKGVLASYPDSKNHLSTKSTTVSTNRRVSLGSLNGVRPLLIPTTITPKSVEHKDNINRNVLPLPYAKFPEGFVPVPKPIVDKKTEEKNNYINSDEAINNRYRNKISSDLRDEAKLEDKEDTGAREVFDQPLPNVIGEDNLALGGLHDTLKQPDIKSNQNKKQHIDNLRLGDKNRLYDGADEIPNDIQLENEADPEEDDDADEYGDHLARPKEPAVRH